MSFVFDAVNLVILC